MTPWAREVNGLLGGAALAVDRGGGHGLGPAGAEDGVAADVDALLGDLHDAAHDDVVDQRRVEVVALGDRREGLRGEVDGVDGAELAVALAARGADNVDDDCRRAWGSPISDRRGDLPDLRLRG